MNELEKEKVEYWKEFGIPEEEVSSMLSPSPPINIISTLEDIRTHLGECARCVLCNTRKNIVFGSGNPKARLMFVGEGPGADEDKEALPFVGRAGQLLTKIIEAMGYQRDEVYITNIVKCRPPENRIPDPEEIKNCSPFLKLQIESVNPQIIVALGLTASVALSGREISMGELRGQFHPYINNPTIAVMATYHPAYLLRNPDAKKTVWSDLKNVNAKLNETLH